MKKIRVLHVLNTGNYAGAEHVAVSIIKATRDQTDSAYVSPNGKITSVLKNEEIKHYEVKELSRRSLISVIREFHPEIIHAHDFTAGVIASTINTKAFVISHIHHNAPWIGKVCLKTIIYRIASVKFRKILFVSKATKNEYIFLRAIKRKSIVVGNPVDVERIRRLSKDKNKDAVSYDILFVGRFEEAKDPLKFVDIVLETKKKLPYIRAAMIGDGELENDIKDKINILSLTNTIDLPGFIQNPYPYMKDAKVVCIPSKWEGYGLVAVESIALGTPVVASDVGGLKDTIDEKCGKLCDANEAFVNEIVRIISEESYRKKKGDACILKTKCMNTYRKYMSRIQEQYTEMLRG